MRYKKIMVIDATWLIRRNYHATNKSSKIISPENIDILGDIIPASFEQDKNIVIISFLQSLLKLIKDNNYQYQIICCFDYGTWRYRPKEKFIEYKSSRIYDNSFQCCWDATSDVVKLLPKLGIITIQIPGLEADDHSMFFSHNSEECLLITSDHDWKQSITPTTKINLIASKITLTYDDIVKDHISTPYDLAIEKAIIGGHDNLRGVDLSTNTIESFNGACIKTSTIQGYKNRSLPQEVLDAIDYNMNLSRLDKILNDTEVHDIILQQEKKVSTNVTQINLLTELSILNNYPSYFLGVLGKYCKIFT